MSKTKGNVTDPLQIIDKIGADALRYAVVTWQCRGQRQQDVADQAGSRTEFANKLWNATRFVIKSIPTEGKST